MLISASDLMTEGPPPNAKSRVSIPDFVKDLRERLRDIHSLISKNTLELIQRMMTKVQPKCQSSWFLQRFLVWLRNPVWLQGNHQSDSDIWMGHLNNHTDQ